MIDQGIDVHVPKSTKHVLLSGLKIMWCRCIWATFVSNSKGAGSSLQFNCMTHYFADSQEPSLTLCPDHVQSCTPNTHEHIQDKSYPIEGQCPMCPSRYARQITHTFLLLQSPQGQLFLKVSGMLSMLQWSSKHAFCVVGVIIAEHMISLDVWKSPTVCCYVYLTVFLQTAL